MHTPPFLLSHHLSDWPDCRLELRCCGRMVPYPVKLLIKRHGDPTFAQALTRVRCKECGGKAAPVYLCAGQHREFCGGSPADWAIELVPVPKP